MVKLPRMTNFARKIVPTLNQRNDSRSRTDMTDIIPVRFIILFVVILSCAVDYITRVSEMSYNFPNIPTSIESNR